MNENDLKALFDDVGDVSASDTARQRARQAALQAFTADHAVKKDSDSSQGKPESIRPIHTLRTWIGEKIMNKKTKLVIGGFATAGLIGVVFVTTSQYRVVDSQAPMVAYEETRTQPESGIDKSELDRQIAAVSKRQQMESQQRMKMAPPHPAAMADVQSAAIVSSGAPAAMSFVPPLPQESERYPEFEESGVFSVSDQPVSTFSMDVDTSAYSNVRRMLNSGHLPGPESVRIEEMINYFDYDYPAPDSKNVPFRTSVGVSESPWKAGNRLVHIGIKAYAADTSEQPDSNLVFLVDISGSMNSRDKLPLVKQSLQLLLKKLKPTDTISIVTYASGVRVALNQTAVADSQTIISALENLSAGGSTAGQGALELAYKVAEAGFNKEAVNRIILATDGDFNVGISDPDKLKSFIKEKRDSGVYLSVLGFGSGNYRDDVMQSLAQNGNGTAAYIDTISEAYKLLSEEALSTLFPVAKDAKIQVEFNPATVSEYRLIGYETRALKREDFKNDKVDAGEVGSGHQVTAIYEITPTGSDSGLVGSARYPGNRESQDEQGFANEYGHLRIRYKLPGEETSRLMTQAIAVNSDTDELLQQEFGFATAVAGFAQILKGSKYVDWDYSQLIALAKSNVGSDDFGYRGEFISLVRKAEVINKVSE